MFFKTISSPIAGFVCLSSSSSAAARHHHYHDHHHRMPSSTWMGGSLVPARGPALLYNRQVSESILKYWYVWYLIYSKNLIDRQNDDANKAGTLAQGLFIVVAILYKVDADHFKISDTQSATKGSVSLATKTASLWEGICIWCEKVFVFDVNRFSCLCFLWACICTNVYSWPTVVVQ